MIVDEDDLLQQLIGCPHQDAVHRSQQHRQRFVVERNDDGDSRKVHDVVLPSATLRMSRVGDVPLEWNVFAQRHVDVERLIGRSAWVHEDGSLKFSKSFNAETFSKFVLCSTYHLTHIVLVLESCHVHHEKHC